MIKKAGCPLLLPDDIMNVHFSVMVSKTGTVPSCTLRANLALRPLQNSADVYLWLVTEPRLRCWAGEAVLSVN